MLSTKEKQNNCYHFFLFCNKVENQISTYNPQGFIVVYAVDDETTVDVAEQILSYFKSEDIIASQAVILVANKTDLVRSRVVSSNGKNKMEWDMMYMDIVVIVNGGIF